MQICADSDAAIGNVAGEGDARRVRRPSRCERDRIQVRDLVLVRAVVVHHPDFLVAAAPAYKRNLRLGDAGLPAAEEGHDVVRKLVRELASAVFRHRAAINFLQRERSCRITYLREIAGKRQTRTVLAQIAVRDHVRAGRRCGPILRLQIARLAGIRQRIKAGAHQIDNAGILEIGPEHVVKNLRKRRTERRFPHRVGDGEACFGYAKARAGLEPSLRCRGIRRAENCECD